MNLCEFQDIVRSGASDHVEFKRDARDLSAIGRAVCAFANSTRGIVAIGIADNGLHRL